MLFFASILCSWMMQGEKNDIDLIFNGKNFLGFRYAVGGTPENVFRVKDGCMVLQQRQGYTYTEKHFKNFELTFEYKYIRPADLSSDTNFKGTFGILLHFNSKHIAWPEWPLCVEVEAKPEEVGKLLVHDMTRRDRKSVPRDKMIGKFTDDESSRRKSLRGIGEWNTFKIINTNADLKVWHNDQLISQGTLQRTDSEGQAKARTDSPIAFMSKGYEVHLKNIRVKEIP